MSPSLRGAPACGSWLSRARQRRDRPCVMRAWACGFREQISGMAVCGSCLRAARMSSTASCKGTGRGGWPKSQRGIWCPPSAWVLGTPGGGDSSVPALLQPGGWLTKMGAHLPRGTRQSVGTLWHVSRQQPKEVLIRTHYGWEGGRSCTCSCQHVGGGSVHPKGQGAGRCPQALTALEAQEAGRGRSPWGNPSVAGMTSDLAGGGES